MPWWRMPAQPLFERTNDLMLVTVQIQGFDGSPANGSNAVQTESHPTKVMIPRVLARMEESCGASSLRITGILPCSFAQ